MEPPHGKGGKEPGPQKFHQAHAGALPDNAGEHIAVHAVVSELGAGLEPHARGEKVPQPVLAGDGPGLVEVDAAAHGQQVPHCDSLHPPEGQGVCQRGEPAGKDIADVFLQRELSLPHQHANCQGGKAFAHGVGYMPHILPVRGKGAGAHHLSMAKHHQGMGVDGGMDLGPAEKF